MERSPRLLVSLLVAFATLGIITASALAAGAWSSHADLPTGRGALVAERVGDKIYVIGADETWWGHSRQPVTEVYDPLTDSWSTAAPVPDLGTWGPSSGVVNDKIYVIGGWPSGHFLTREYDPDTDTWSYKAPIPAIFSWGHTSATVGNTIYMISGGGPHVLAYHPISDAWTTGLSPIPVNNTGLAAAAIDGLIYVVGTGEDLQVYDPVADAWSTGPDLPVGTSAPSAVALDGKLLVFGGVATGPPGGVLATTQVYDPLAGLWSLLPDMPTARSWSASATANDAAYVFGGFQLDNTHVAANESISLNAPPDCSTASPSVEEIWPANHKLVDVDVLGVSDPDGDTVSITIDAISQDEPVDHL